MTAASQPGLVFKLSPTGPSRVGPGSGARDDVDPIYHSDSLYSAVTGAMRLLGHLDGWLPWTLILVLEARLPLASAKPAVAGRDRSAVGPRRSR